MFKPISIPCLLYQAQPMPDSLAIGHKLEASVVINTENRIRLI